MGGQTNKISRASTGEFAALGKFTELAAGSMFTDASWQDDPNWVAPPAPMASAILLVENKSDEIKLSSSIAKLIEEDPSLSVEQSQETGELVLHGQGMVHLQVMLDRLRGRFGMRVSMASVPVLFRETIRREKHHGARFKRQSGGHGQFADVKLSVWPLPRGEGFVFENRVVGGSVPGNFIPAVEQGARDAMVKGPLGYRVIDIGVALTDGLAHSVDSSELAFRTAGRIAVSEALAMCDPVVLEPYHRFRLFTPAQFTSRVQRLVASRRGRLLGFDLRDGWEGWEVVEASMPQAVTGDLVAELRAVTLGVGGFESVFETLRESEASG